MHMEVTIHANGLTVNDRTHQNKDFLKSKGFTWKPSQNVWTHTDLNAQRVFPRYQRFTDLRRFQYLKKNYEDRKVAALQVCESLPLDVTREIIKMAHFPKCVCVDNWVCYDCKYACCENATKTFCVCTHATMCPVHGRMCNGSHD